LTIDPAILLALRLFLAGVLAATALHKASQGSRFVDIVRDYQIAPASLAPVLATLVALLEGALAAALLIGGAAGFAAVAAAGLFALYALAIGVNLARGRTAIDCGCSFGAFRGNRLSGALLYRNAALFLLALAAAMPAGPREIGANDAMIAAIAAASFAAIYFAADILIGNAARFAATERRA
jgi:uncharacterized membrane protein YphA (DoxX/SURF4 family)